MSPVARKPRPKLADAVMSQVSLIRVVPIGGVHRCRSVHLRLPATARWALPPKGACTGRADVRTCRRRVLRVRANHRPGPTHFSPRWAQPVTRLYQSWLGAEAEVRNGGGPSSQIERLCVACLSLATVAQWLVVVSCCQRRPAGSVGLGAGFIPS